MFVEGSVDLIRHPDSEGDPVRRIEARVRRSRAELAFVFRVAAESGRIHVPPSRPPRFRQGLWQHTCFEAFVAVDGAPAYHEFNFSPSGEWAAYRFRSYRDGEPLEDESLAGRIEFRGLPDRLELEATVPLDRLSTAHVTAALRIGLAAVVETVDRKLSYWALHHPAGKPDFHQERAFELRLEPPAREC